MKKLVLPWLIILLAFTSAMAQTVVKGTVKSNRNKPLSGISITLINSYDGATSDSLGNYSFSTTEKGKFMLEAKSLGFTPVTQPIELEGKIVILDFILKEEISELKAVVVSAYADLSNIRTAMNRGAFDFITAYFRSLFSRWIFPL